MTDPHELADFGSLFDLHYPALHRYLRRRAGPDVADDLAAQTFVVAMHGRRRYDSDRARPGPWLWGIAHNLLREHRRSEERQLSAYARTGVDPVQPAEADEAVARADAAGLAPRLAAALAGLRHEDRDILLLVAWSDLGYAEVAQVLRIPVGTVRSRLHRTRRRLSAQLGIPVTAATADLTVEVAP